MKHQIHVVYNLYLENNVSKISKCEIIDEEIYALCSF
jgi:hypothetical protein